MAPPQLLPRQLTPLPNPPLAPPLPLSTVRLLRYRCSVLHAVHGYHTAMNYQTFYPRPFPLPLSELE